MLQNDLKTLKKAATQIIRGAAKARFRRTLRAGLADARTAPYRKFGFTLAEVLITLGVIGIVAAMTIPTLVQSYKKKVVEVKLLSTYSMLSQAVKLSEIDNGPISNWDIPLQIQSDDGNPDWTNNRSLSYNIASRYLAPYLKYTKFVNDGKDTPYMYLNNGVMLRFWRGSNFDIIIDTNGDAKPNKDGYDRFRIFIEKNGIFSPNDRSREKLLEDCKSTALLCLALIQYDGWKISDDYPYSVK